MFRYKVIFFILLTISLSSCSDKNANNEEESNERVTPYIYTITPAPIINTVTPIPDNTVTLIPNNTVSPTPVNTLYEIHIDNEEKRMMNIFLSCFAQGFIQQFDINNVSYKDLIEFAVSYNYINNYDLFIEVGDYNAKILEDKIEVTIYEYFGVTDIVHQSIDDEIIYKDNYYFINQADGEAMPFVQIEKISKNNNDEYIVEGIIYDNVDNFYGDPYEPKENWTVGQSIEVGLTCKVSAIFKKVVDNQVSRYILLKYDEIHEPSRFSENLFDYIIKLGNDYYQLPIPVNTFITNGWEFEDDMLNNKHQALGNHEKVTMTRDGSDISVRIANYDSQEHIYQDCVVVSVKSEDNIIGTSFEHDTLPEISSVVTDYTNNNGVHIVTYAILDYLYCSQGYFYNYVNDRLSSVEVSYYYTEEDREKRKQTVLMNWKNDTVVYPKREDVIQLDLDTVYQIDLDNDDIIDKIDVKVYDDTEGVFSVVINGEPTIVYEDFYYFKRSELLKTSNDRYLIAMCYGGINDHEKTDIYLIENNHIRMTASAVGGIHSYSDQVLVVGDFIEFDGLSDYEDTFILSNDGKLNRQGDSVLYHTHTAAFDFKAYLYNSEANQYQSQLIKKGTIVTLLHTDWDTVWIELENGIQGYFIADDFNVWECFSGEGAY